MAWVDDDREMAQALYCGHNAQIESISRVIGKRANASLAEDNIVIPFSQDVLGRHQKFFERGGHAALQQDGLAGSAGAPQKRKILHIAGSDLDAVRIPLDE